MGSSRLQKTKSKLLEQYLLFGYLRFSYIPLETIKLSNTLQYQRWYQSLLLLLTLKIVPQ